MAKPNQWFLVVLAVLLFLAVLGAVSWRLSGIVLVPGSPSLAQPGLASFRDAIYYPMIAVGEGVNPYDSVRDGNPQRYMERYPVGSHFPLYSPLLLLLHAPLATLPLGLSMLVYCALNVVLLVVFAWAAIRCCGLKPSIAGVFALAAVLLASQPGRANFNSGQPALLLSLAACGALANTRRPLWAAISLALLTLKPTFGGPLGLLLYARRQPGVATLGLGLGALIALTGGALIFARSGDLSVEGVTAIVHANHAHFVNDPEHDFDETCRLDLAAAIERLTGQTLPTALKILVAAIVLGLTAVALWRASAHGDEESAGSVTSALAVVAMYVCVYHLIYDAVLLAVPALAAALGRHPSWQRFSRPARWSLAALLLVPMVNIFWTSLFESAIESIGIPWGRDGGPTAAVTFRLVSAASGIAISAAWVVLIRYTVWHPSAELETQSLRATASERAA